MLILKFGGQTLVTVERIKRVGQIIQAIAPQRGVVVVSALGGVTDELARIAQAACRTGAINLSSLQHKHQRILQGLGLNPHLLDPLWMELHLTLKGISLLRELTPRTLDFVLSFGERLSARLVASYLDKQQIPAVALDAHKIGLVTDSNFGNAHPLPESAAAIRRHLRSIKKKLPVVTGFIGIDKHGEITTLGRDGSDYTASFIGAALGVREIQIWREIDGIMTADPYLVKKAHPVKHITLEEASELVYYGKGILHPYMLKPAVDKHIPVRILSIYHPNSDGTLIVSKDRSKEPIKIIVSQKGNYLINIISHEIFHHRGLIHRVFEIINRHRVFVHLLVSSEISLSFMTFSLTPALREALAEINSFAQANLLKNKAIIGIIGKGIKRHPEILTEIFETLQKASITVELISHNASRTNFTLVVDDLFSDRAVQILHKKFFE